MDLIDTHCHPQFDSFLPDPEAPIKEAKQAGVTKLIAVGTTLADSQKAIDFAQKHQNIWSSAGVHPHDAEEFLNNKRAKEELAKLLDQSSIVGVGEIGLDYFKNYSKKDDQLEIFRQQMEVGLKTGLPFIFHVREAFDDFWRIYDTYNYASKPITGVIHSFSATTKELDEALVRGLYIGLNGIMTFTNDDKQLEAAKKVPKDRLLLETDAPFLAPKPFRGQPCQPKFIVETAKFLAHLRGESLEELANNTTKNAVELFGFKR